MNITYSKYPALLYMSFDTSTAPEELPFIVTETDMEPSNFEDFWQYLIEMNDKQARRTRYKTVNVYLPDSIYKKLSVPGPYLEEVMRLFYKLPIPHLSGTILIDNDDDPLTYVYTTLNKDFTGKYLDKDGECMTAALLKGNQVLGFEVGIKKQDKIEVFTDGIYNDQLHQGDLLNFLSSVLPFLLTNELKAVHSDLNQTKELIFQIE